MSEQLVKDYLLEWAGDYCRDDFTTNTPAGVNLFVEKGLDYVKDFNGVASESLGDYSVSFLSDSGFPLYLLKMLAPYKRIKFL